MNFTAIAVIALLAVAVLALWPGRGLLTRLRLRTATRERERLEDVLKQLYTAEHAGQPVTLESVAGALELSRDRVVRLLSVLVERGLGRSTDAGYVLTEAGRADALRVLRAHRLWERYLADRTGVRPEDWHEKAERREHRMSREETEELAARLGHPFRDPHGDPIPAADGAILPLSGVPLASLAPGDVALVTHVEDEPRRVFERLVAAGIGAGVRVEVLAAEDGHVRIRVGGRDEQLEPVVAANVTAQRVAGAEPEAGVTSLSTLEAGGVARVVRISATCQGPQRQRLLDLGVVPGTRIRAALESTSGDPVAYEIRGALIALRRSQADLILVHPENGGGRG